MAKTDIWPTIRAERAALAADLEPLDGDRWETQSLCDDWTVRDVLAHMAATAMITVPGFFRKMVGSGFRITKMQAADIAAVRGSSPADTLARFRSVVDSTKHPPGPGDTWLGETIVHAEDIRRPLGITHDYPVEMVTRAADFYVGSNLVMGSKRRVAGLGLRATDADWSHGEGPEVTGPALSLLLALTGRKEPIADLSGDGVATLTSRG